MKLNTIRCIFLLPFTPQRRVVFEAMLRHIDHPTADQIYQDVKQQMPNVSRTTVYRVLETLVELEMLRRVNHTGSSARFDPNIGHHHHLICQSCQSLIDLDASEMETITLPNIPTDDFRIADYSIYFSGICGDCQRLAKETDNVV